MSRGHTSSIPVLVYRAALLRVCVGGWEAARVRCEVGVGGAGLYFWHSAPWGALGKSPRSVPPSPPPPRDARCHPSSMMLVLCRLLGPLCSHSLWGGMRLLSPPCCSVALGGLWGCFPPPSHWVPQAELTLCHGLHVRGRHQHPDTRGFGAG